MYVPETHSTEGGQSPGTQDMSSGQIYEETEIHEEAEDQEEEFDWFIEQTPFTEQASPLDAPKYGFANQKSGVFQRLQVDFLTQLFLVISKIICTSGKTRFLTNIVTPSCLNHR